MKRVYIVARNHMDPSWLRCFKDHFNHPDSGDVVRPYSDVEELQILEYMDFAEKYGVKYQLEQSLVVKEFLRRNPDQEERFRALVKKGLIELAGGGEAVIDVNLTEGESWVRNHLYSREYYKKEFGHTPRYAITPDIFGLASQLPQFFRSIGYDALIIFDRVMKNNKPFWRGLDGTLIVLDNRFLQPPEPNLRTADCVKIPPCKACRGIGCELCEGTGIDITYNITRPDKELLQSAYYGNMSAGEMLDKLLETDKDEYFVMITAEEPRVGDFLFGPLKEAAAERDMEIKYVTFEENHDIWCRGQVDALRRGDHTEDEIDTRAEGNPVSCGCYTSRIKIKQANRELEHLLVEAETLAALVLMRGGWDPDAVPRRDYPQKKIEALWNKMAFIQFHDNVPGSHCDASYHELKTYIREVRRGAEQIYRDAALEWARLENIAIPEGYNAAVYFNPTAQPANLPVLALHAPEGTKHVDVFDVEGYPLPSFDPEFSPMLVGVGVELRVLTEIPAFGRRVFLWKASDKPEPKGSRSSEGELFTIENEYFRVMANGRQITCVYDKKANRELLDKGGLCLCLGVDEGSPWGRSAPERDHRPVFADNVCRETNEIYSRFILTGTVVDEAHKIKRLAWKQTVTLYRGEALVRCRTELDWDGADTRVFANFPPMFDCDGKIYCEVPFGTMARDMPGITENLGITDEWPSLGFAGLSNGKYSMAVLKGGLPAARLHDGALQISLLRSFEYDNPTYRGTTERARHVSEYAVAAWRGAFADGDAQSLAAKFNQFGRTLELSRDGMLPLTGEQPLNRANECGCLFPALTGMPKNLGFSAFKRAEDGNGFVLRLWESAGKETALHLDGVRLLRCNSLEEPETEEWRSEYTFRPFEIATFRCKF